MREYTITLPFLPPSLPLYSPCSPPHPHNLPSPSIPLLPLLPPPSLPFHSLRADGDGAGGGERGDGGLEPATRRWGAAGGEAGATRRSETRLCF